MKLDRIISIIMLLLQKEKVTAKYLAETFEVSIRTIYRDIDSINLAGIPMVTMPGSGGGVSIMNGYKIEKGIFTKNDLSKLLMGTNIASGAIKDQETAIILSKLKSIIPKEHQQEVFEKANFVSYNFSILNDKNLKNTLENLYSAIESKNIITFYYWSKNQKKKRQIEPYKLFFQYGHWYVQGYCLDCNDFRVFKISRLWGFAQLNTNFVSRQLPIAFKDYNEYMQSKQIIVKLIVDASILNMVLDHCDYSSVRQCTLDKYFVNFPFIPSEYDYGILLSFGEKCKCISPIFVREKLIEKINNLQKNYQ